MKIGFYDSGLGGIKTLKDIINMGLKEEIYFLADTKNSPYGIKDIDEVKRLAMENVQKLVDLGCKIVVVACNTATSVAIADLRDNFKNVEIIGTEPAVKLAIDENLDKNVLIIATSITVNGEKLNKLIYELQTNIKVELQAADTLVRLIEDESFLNNQEEIDSYLKEILSSYNLSEFSHIILGCTHFPIVKENIEKIAKCQNRDIKVIDGNEGIGKNIFRKMENREDLEKRLDLHILTTSDNKSFYKRAGEILENIKFVYKA